MWKTFHSFRKIVLSQTFIQIRTSFNAMEYIAFLYTRLYEIVYLPAVLCENSFLVSKFFDEAELLQFAQRIVSA